MGLRRHNPEGGIVFRRSPALRLLDDTVLYRLRSRATDLRRNPNRAGHRTFATGCPRFWRSARATPGALKRSHERATGCHGVFNPWPSPGTRPTVPT
jgi:hypothetical protein